MSRKRDDWPPEVEIDEDAFEHVDEAGGRTRPWWLVLVLGFVGGALGGLIERVL